MSYIAQVFEPPDCWPKTTIDQANSPAAPEKGRKTVAMTAAQATFFRDLFFSYSRNNKLRRVAAFRNRYRLHLKERTQLRRSGSDTASLSVSSRSKTPPIPPLTTAELHHNEHLICRLAQHETFAEECSDLAIGDRVAKSSALKWLKPFIDEDGTLRVGGRLRTAALSIANKHPMVLFAKHPLSALLASSYHVSLLHAGPQLLLVTLRQKFWILGGRNLVKSVFHQCHTCFPLKPTLVQQSTADLPGTRTSPTCLSSVYGTENYGPLYVKTSSKMRSYQTLRGPSHLMQPDSRHRGWHFHHHQGGQRSASKLAAEKKNQTSTPERTVSSVL
nr:uncharacterized protein LOC115255874 [Aedes albopictus]